MARMTDRAFTLVELMAVVAIVFMLFILLIPQFNSMHGPANRASCANNLKQIGTALNLYESIPAYNCFPVDSSSPDPMKSMGILYKDFVGDARVFSCASHPTYMQLERTLTPGSKNPSAGNLTATLSGFGYDPGYGTPNVPHNSGDSMAVVCADILKGGTSANPHISANHKGAGINVLFCSGSVEWHDAGKTGLIAINITYVENGKTIQFTDPDIYSANTLTEPNLDSNVRP